MLASAFLAEFDSMDTAAMESAVDKCIKAVMEPVLAICKAKSKLRNHHVTRLVRNGIDRDAVQEEVAVYLNENGNILEGKELSEHARPVMQNFGRVSDQPPGMGLLQNLLDKHVLKFLEGSQPLRSLGDAFTWKFVNESIGHTRRRTSPGPDGMP
eukprot:gene6839-6525_t